MAVSKNEILETISNMTVMEVVELIEAMEEKFNVSAAAAAVAVAAPAAGAAAAEEKTEFDVVMTSFGANKVGVIKAIREITGLGLKEAKDLVDASSDAAPKVLKDTAPKAEADEIKKKVEAAGAKAVLKGL